MEHANLWAPWRMQYLKGLDESDPPACFLCQAIEGRNDDEKSLVLCRDAHGVLIMNRYPYTTGHIMAVPTQHAGDLCDLTAAQRAGLMELVVLGQRLIHAVLNPQGMNIGTNVGRAAGAGLPGHLHVHLVPRWGGDTNFINIIGQVRVIPQALETVYGELKAALPKVCHVE